MTTDTESGSLISERVAGGILPKVLTTFDMVAIFVAIVLFITNAAVIQSAGPPAFGWWIIGFVVFLIPCAIATGQLGAMFPGEGSIYLWTHKAFGPVLRRLLRVVAGGAGDGGHRRVDGRVPRLRVPGRERLADPVAGRADHRADRGVRADRGRAALPGRPDERGRRGTAPGRCRAAWGGGRRRLITARPATLGEGVPPACDFVTDTQIKKGR